MVVLALLALSAPVRVFELVDPTATEVSIQAIARTPDLITAHFNSLDLLIDEIPRTVGGFSHRDMMDTTNGDQIHCVAGPDYVRIYFSVPPTHVRAGLSLLEALVHNSELAPPEDMRPRKVSAWEAALRPYQAAGSPRQADVQELYRTLFRPENITLAVGGPIVPGEAQADWQRRVDQWQLVRISRPALPDPEPKIYMKNPGGLASVELAGPVIAANDASLPTQTLALIALGSGKGASLFRVARQKLGYSYRQEALLYPVADGWQPRLITVMRPVDDLIDRGTTLRKSLLEDVSSWTQSDLDRALGMADAVFSRGVDFSPFAFGPTGAIDASLESRTFQTAYWQLKTGSPWDAEAFLAQMRKVSLEDLQASSKKILTDAQLRILPG